MSSASGRVGLITGASAGIGYATALEFARRGFHVGATARRADRLSALRDAANGLPGTILPIVADVRRADDMLRAVHETVAAFGRLDILVANAGLGQRGSLIDAPWQDLEDVLRTNIDGVLHSVRAAVPEIRKAGGGHVVMISSITALITTPYATTYAATKSALNAFARGLRQELRPDHIWVTTLLVGQTVSEFAQARRGQPGHISAVRSMPAEKVATAVVRAVTQRRRRVTLRPLDRVLMAAGQYLPWITDRLVARAYKT